MSQQGDRSGHEDDWWAELYDPRRSDAGPAAAADSVDDRFDSAFRTLAGDRDTGDHRPAAGALWEPRAGDQGGAAPGSDADAGGGPQGWRSPDGEGPGAAPPSQDRAAGSGVVPSRTEPGVPWADSGSGVTSGGAGSGAASGGAGSGAASGGVGSGTASGAAGSGVASSRTEPGVPSGGAGSGATPGGADPRTALEGADSKTTPGGADRGAVSGRMGPGGTRGRDGGRDGAQRGADPEAVAGRTEPGAAPGRAASPAPASATPPPPPRPATPPPSPPPPPRPATPPPPRPATPPPPSAPPTSPRDAGPPAAPRRTPQADPSRPWRSAAAGYVGDGPPTYEAEPTTLPVADPEDLRDLVPDTVLEGARYGTLTLRAASMRGDSARYRGEPRRDALLAARFGTGDSALILVAVASGQRAAPGTHRAARELCEWIAEAVGRNRARLTEDVHTANRGALVSGLHRLTDRAYGRLRADATERGLAPADYTASVRCLLLPAHPACRTRVFFGMGDGGLFRLRDGVWQDLEPAETEPEPAPTSAPASAPAPDPDPAPASAPAPISASTSVPSPAPFRFRASVARPGDTLLLCSAGLADPLRGEAALADHLAERWGAAEPPGLSAFLADAQTGVKGYADDRTAVAVWEA
nr:protein phosphatase 2C domain-containing protein [Streptomyces hygroscopicus]